jgi:ADP-heptose:LPS heptosyltransferase
VESVLDRLPQGSRVAILRLRSLGDCVLTTPALDILKRARPDLRLAIVVEDRFRAIFEGNPDLDRVLPPDLGALRGWRPQLCINLHGGTRSAWMTALSGARYRAGFGHFRHRFVYNVHIPRAQSFLGVDRVVHTAEHLASAMFHLGAPLVEIPRAKLFTVGRTPRSAADALVGPLGIGLNVDSIGDGGSGGTRADQGVRPTMRPYAVLHPFAATAEKAWRSEGFLAVAEHLKQSGLEPTFIGGPIDDLSPFRAFRTISNPPLSETKRLLSAASLFVGNDSGPAHMAAAFGLPVVGIFGASDPAIWGPWRTASVVVTAPGGISRIDTAQVLDALTRLRVHA